MHCCCYCCIHGVAGSTIEHGTLCIIHPLLLFLLWTWGGIAGWTIGDDTHIAPVEILSATSPLELSCPKEITIHNTEHRTKNTEHRSINTEHRRQTSGCTPVDLSCPSEIIFTSAAAPAPWLSPSPAAIPSLRSRRSGSVHSSEGRGGGGGGRIAIFAGESY